MSPNKPWSISAEQLESIEQAGLYRFAKEIWAEAGQVLKDAEFSDLTYWLKRFGIENRENIQSNRVNWLVTI